MLIYFNYLIPEYIRDREFYWSFHSEGPAGSPADSTREIIWRGEQGKMTVLDGDKEMKMITEKIQGFLLSFIYSLFYSLNKYL